LPLECTPKNEKKGAKIIQKHQEIDREFQIHWVERNNRNSPKNSYNLFTVKRSTIPGAGYGLFAAQNFREGDYLGVYYGRILGKKEKPEGNYIMAMTHWGKKLFVDGGGGVDKNFPTYFGLHLMNNPGWKSEDSERQETKKKAGESSSRLQSSAYKAIVCHNLECKAIKDIKIGDELFLNYNYCSELL